MVFKWICSLDERQQTAINNFPSLLHHSREKKSLSTWIVGRNCLGRKKEVGKMQMRRQWRHSRDCLFAGGLHPSKVVARRSYKFIREMHFSHDIVVVYWRHKFLLHNGEEEEEWWLAVDVNSEQRQQGLNGNLPAFFHVFLLLFLSGSRKKTFSLTIVRVAFVSGCTTFMFTTKIINCSGIKEMFGWNAS